MAMRTDDAFAKMVTLLSPYLVRGLVNTQNPMPKVKVILEDLRAAAHAEGYAAGAEEAHERGYDEGYEHGKIYMKGGISHGRYTDFKPQQTVCYPASSGGTFSD